MQKFIDKLIKIFGKKKITVGKIKGRYMTSTTYMIFGMNFIDEVRKSTEEEKTAARKAAK